MRAWLFVALLLGQTACSVAHVTAHHHHGHHHALEKPRDHEEIVLETLILGLVLSGTGIGTSLWQTSQEDRGAHDTLTFLKSVYCPLSEIGAQLHAARAQTHGYVFALELERAANFLVFRHDWCEEFSQVVIPRDLQKILTEKVIDKVRDKVQDKAQDALLDAALDQLTSHAIEGALSSLNKVKTVAKITLNLFDIATTSKMTWLQWLLGSDSWGPQSTFQYEFDPATQKGHNSKAANDEVWLQFGFGTTDVGRAAKPLRALFRDFHHARHFSKATFRDADAFWLPVAVAQAQAVSAEPAHVLAAELREQKLVALWPYWELLRPHVKKEMRDRDPLVVGAMRGREVQIAERHRARLKLMLTPEFEICDTWSEQFCGCDTDPWKESPMMSCRNAIRYWNSRKARVMGLRRSFSGVYEELTGAILRKPIPGLPIPHCESPADRVRINDKGERELRGFINIFSWEKCKSTATFFCTDLNQPQCHTPA